MPHAAALGLELPCRRVDPHAAQLLIYMDQHCIGWGSPRPGRLCPPRRVGRALHALLQAREADVRRQLLALPPGQAQRAQALVADHRHWEAQVRRTYLTPHHLRRPCSDRFCCWALPMAVLHQLQRQATQPPCGTVVRLLFLLPIDPSLRLLDKVSVFHHPASRYLVGPWQSWPDERVHARISLGCLVVVVW